MSDLIINVEKKTRKVTLKQVYLGNDHENLQENLIFQFDEFVNGQARLEYEINGQKNYIILTKEEDTYTIPVQNVITIYQEETEGNINFQLVVTEGTDEENVPVFKSNIFYLRCRPSINAVGEAPEGYDLWIEQANAKLNLIDETIATANQKIGLIDDAITATNNLDLDVSKTNKTATVTLTKKDASVKTVQINDGLSLQFMWQGTSLGIKTEDQENYTFVNLQGIQGVPGPQGEPFKIKKTYSSVSEMNADFNNMEYGDYVMIASTVEVEDNAKLYTRGEYQWIFITDFSGATGIQGPTGATPNISIGTVTSGSTPSVTRTGTNENPVLNFVLEPGEKGDTGNTGPTGNGISNIEKTAETSSEKSYRINYTNGDYFDYTVENGEVTQAQLDEVIAENQALKDQIPTGTGTGEYITLTDSAGDINWKSIKPNGKTEQESTTGKNLASLETSSSLTIGGVPFNIENGIINLNGTTSSGSSSFYFNSFRTNSGSAMFWIEVTGYTDKANQNASIILQERTENSSWSTTREITLTSTVQKQYQVTLDNSKYYRIRFYTIANIFTNATIKIQLEYGSEKTSWEEYSGGSPAPNPSFPQEIKNVEGKNRFNQNKILEATGWSINNEGYYNGIAGNLRTYLTNNSIISNIKKNTQYTFKWTGYLGTATNARMVIQYSDGTTKNSTWINSTTEMTGSVTSDVGKTISSLNLNYSDNGTLFIKNIELEEGSIATPYVPYNSIEIKVENVNILNRATCTENVSLIWTTSNPNAETGSLATNFIKVSLNQDFSFSYKAQVLFFDKNKEYLGALDYNKTGIAKSAGSIVNTVKVPNINGIEYMRLGFRASNNTGVDLLTANIMVNEGTTLLPYVVHAEQTSLFTFGEGQYLAEGGYLADDGIHNELNKIVLDGVTEGKKITGVSLYSSSGLYYCVCSLSVAGISGVNGLLSTHFIPQNSVQVGNIYITGSRGTNLVFILADQTITTVEQANAWIQEQYSNGTPVTVEYKLADPQPTPYTSAQQAQWEEIKKMKTYKNVSHISTEGGTLEPSNDVVYYKDLETLFANLA